MNREQIKQASLLFTRLGALEHNVAAVQEKGTADLRVYRGAPSYGAPLMLSFSSEEYIAMAEQKMAAIHAELRELGVRL